MNVVVRLWEFWSGSVGVVGGGGQFECYYENVDALKLYYYVFMYDLGNLWKHNDTI